MSISRITLVVLLAISPSGGSWWHQVATAASRKTFVARSIPDVTTIAREVTVRVNGPAVGSGVIVERNADTYSVLTNAHVVERPGTYTVITANGDRYSVDPSTIQRLPNLDLALLSFTSLSSYRTVQIAKTVTEGEPVTVGGWTRSGNSLNQRVFVSTQGELTETTSALPQGYALTYTNLVRVGMSGGPILNQQGELIGINGLVRLADDANTVVASGIDIKQFLNWYSRSGLPTSNPSPEGSGGCCEQAQPAATATSPYTIAATLNASSASVTAVALGSNIVGGSSDGTISVWSTDGQLVRSWQAHAAAVNAIAMSVDGQIIASGSDDRTIKLWQADTGELIRTLSGHQDAVSALVFTASGQLASGSWDKTIKLWQISTGQLVRSLTDHSGVVSALAITPDGTTLASGSQDATVRLWNLATGKPQRTLEGHSLSVLSLAISPDGNTLASGSGEGTVGIWNLKSGQLVHTLAGHTDGVWAVSIIDAHTVVSGSWDRTMKLWDIHTATLKHTLSHADAVTAIATSPERQILVSGGWQGQIRIWRKPQP